MPGAPQIEGEQPVPHVALARRGAGDAGAQVQRVAELLLRDPRGGGLLARRAGVEGFDDLGELLPGEVLEVAGQEVLDAVLGVGGTAAAAVECAAGVEQFGSRGRRSRRSPCTWRTHARTRRASGCPGRSGSAGTAGQHSGGSRPRGRRYQPPASARCSAPSTRRLPCARSRRARAPSQQHYFVARPSAEQCGGSPPPPTTTISAVTSGAARRAPRAPAPGSAENRGDERCPWRCSFAPGGRVRTGRRARGTGRCRGRRSRGRGR
jgi:hypothetical protein